MFTPFANKFKGREEYDGMRPGLAYSGPNSKSDADVFLICYSIGNPGSLLEATEKWAPELEQHCPGVPFLLVGCKSDVRADVSNILKRVCGFIKVVGHQNPSVISYFHLASFLLSFRQMAAKGQKYVLPNEAQTTADKLGLTAAECLECSAKEKAGVLEIFQMATKTALSYKAASKSRRQNRVFRSIKQRLTGSFRSGGGSIEDPEKLRLRKAAQAVKAKLKEEEEAEKARAKKLIAKEKSEKARLKTEAATFAKAEKEAKAVWKAMYAAASPAEKVRMKEAAAEKEWLKTATPAQIKRRKKEKAADAAAAAAREEYLSRADSTRASASDATVEAPVAGADATYYQIPAAAPQDYEYLPALLPVDSSSNATPVQLGCSTEPETANIPRYMREHLGLSPQDAEMYCAVWGAVESKEGSFVGGAKVFKLFSAAGVVNENRDAIWRLANKSIKGRLVEKEFYVALKLVALHQLDPGMDFNNLTDDPTAVLARTGIPLPQLGALMPSPIEPQQEPIYDEVVVHEPIHVAAAVASGGEEDDDDEHDYNLIGDIDPAEMEAFASNVSRVSKYVAPSLRLGRPKQVALGLENLIGVDTDLANTINAMKEGRILQEFEEHGTDEDKGNLKHVLAGTYREEWGRSKAASVALDALLATDEAKVAELEYHHVLALRLYTTSTYSRINEPLRLNPCPKPHPFAATTLFIRDGIKRLRAVEAVRSAAETKTLWRGMNGQSLPSSFEREGGAEFACMSTTADFKVAVKFAEEEGRVNPMIFKIVTENFMTCGVDIAFLSVYPEEKEVLYPPLTYLQPVSVKRKKVGSRVMVVVEVKPILA